MKKKWKNTHKGYLLVESILSLVVTGIILLTVCTTYVYLKKQEMQIAQEAAASQFLYENSLYQAVRLDDSCLAKKTGNMILRGKNTDNRPQRKVKIVIGETEHEMEILSRSFAAP